MNIKKTLLPLASAVLLSISAGSALATPIFYDGFETTGATDTILNWNGGANWTVNPGSVDLVQSGDYGISCHTGNFCVDLDGSTNAAGELISINVGPLYAGSTYTLSYWLSGNQRNNPQGDAVVAFIDISGNQWYQSLAANAGWTYYSHTFTAASTLNTANLRFAATGRDNIGMVLDDVTLVPEPATLGLLGFGLVGLGFARRRKVSK